MLDILLAVGQFLSVMALVYGFLLCYANRESAEVQAARIAARPFRAERDRSAYPFRSRRAASRPGVSR